LCGFRRIFRPQILKKMFFSWKRSSELSLFIF
jgi:hypothetical protein